MKHIHNAAILVLILAAPALAQEEEAPSWIVEVLIEWVDALFLWILDKICALISPLCPVIPQLPQTLASDISSALGTANLYLPITEGLQMASAYITFQIALIVIKIVWKAIPFTG